MAREPCEFQRRFPRFAASDCLRKRNYLKSGAFRVRKNELVMTVIGKSISFSRHMIQTPGTKPIARRIAGRQGSAPRSLHFPNLQRDFANIRFSCKSPFHNPIFGVIPFNSSTVPRLALNGFRSGASA